MKNIWFWILCIPLLIILAGALCFAGYVLCMIVYVLYKLCEIIMTGVFGTDGTLVIVGTSVVWVGIILYLRSGRNVRAELRRTVKCYGKYDSIQEYDIRAKHYLWHIRWSGAPLSALVGKLGDCEEMFKTEQRSEALQEFISHCHSHGKRIAIVNKQDKTECEL